MTNPFNEDEATTPETETTEAVTSETESETAEENLDVDTPELDEADEADAPEATTETAKAEGKPAKEKKAPARPPVPEGFITPVAFAKILTERGDKEVPPQYVYSTIRSSSTGKNPLPTYSEGGRDNLLKLDEALAWWDEKNKRVAERAANAATKAEKAKEKAAAKADAPVEAEGAEAAPAGELVEAE